MKILVTGGAGFIASHIVDAYIKAGHKVVVIDNLSTGNLRNLNKKAIFYRVDIRDSERVNAIMKKERPEVINHHAAFISVSESARDPLSAYDANVLGTINLLVNAKGVKKFIFASTGGALYAGGQKLPATENSRIAPPSPYGMSKYLAEEAIKMYAGQLGFSYTILRYSNVYGPRQNPHGEAGVVAIFSERMIAGQPVTIYNAKATRDYVFVGDVVSANGKSLTRGAGETMNIGTGKETTNKMLFETMALATAYRGKPSVKPARPGELSRSCLSASHASKKLGWKPEVALRDGIIRTIASYL